MYVISEISLEKYMGRKYHDYLVDSSGFEFARRLGTAVYIHRVKDNHYYSLLLDILVVMPLGTLNGHQSFIKGLCGLY